MILSAVGAAAAAAGLLIGARIIAPSDDTAAGALRSARLTDLDGKSRSLREWDGRVLVCNFWATWCPPCREEIPILMTARDKLRGSGVEFIGIAIDQADKVAEFVRKIKISYPVLLADAAGIELVRKLGNPTGGLPFTLILDKQGAIGHRHIGIVTQQGIEAQVATVLQG